MILFYLNYIKGYIRLKDEKMATKDNNEIESYRDEINDDKYIYAEYLINILIKYIWIFNQKNQQKLKGKYKI